MQELKEFIGKIDLNPKGLDTPGTRVENTTISSRKRSQQLVNDSELKVDETSEKNSERKGQNLSPWTNAKKSDFRESNATKNENSQGGIQMSGGEGSRLFKMGNEKAKGLLQKSTANV